MPGTFLERFLALLEEIEASPEKLEWCKRYSVYDTDWGQDELARSLHALVDQAYTNGLVFATMSSDEFKKGQKISPLH